MRRDERSQMPVAVVERLLPRGKTLSVALSLGADGARSATLSGGSAWTERLATIRSSDPS